MGESKHGIRPHSSPAKITTTHEIPRKTRGNKIKRFSEIFGLGQRKLKFKLNNYDIITS